MSNLIKVEQVEDGGLVVRSRDIAINFEKEHNDTKKRIRELEKDMGEISHNYFYIIEYQDSMNRTQEEYLLNRDGFTLLAMGFTGKKALEWKLKYIEAFNRMESELTKTKKLSPMEQLKLQYEVLDEHEERLSHLEGSMTLDFGQQNVLQNKTKSRVVKMLGGIESKSYKDKSLRARVFSAAWRDYKDYFNVASYRDTAKVDFKKALEYLSNWQAQGRILREIEDCNNQLEIREVM